MVGLYNELINFAQAEITSKLQLSKLRIYAYTIPIVSISLLNRPIVNIVVNQIQFAKR